MTTPLRSSLRRRTTAASAALLLGLGLTACGGDDSGDDAGDDTSSSASPSDSPSEPASASAPTTSDAPDAPSPSPSPSQDAPADVPGEDELRAALLTAADVPEGFTLSPDDDDDEDNPFEGTCLDEVGTFSDALDAEPEEEAEVEFSSEDATAQASVSSKISVYADPAAITTAFADFTGELQDCTSIQSSSEGIDYTFEIAYDDTVDVPGADDQLAFDVTGTLGAGEQVYPADFRFVVALSGPFVSVVGAYTVGEDTSGVTSTTKDLAILQAERVAGLG